jgi:hypothetical protein
VVVAAGVGERIQLGLAELALIGIGLGVELALAHAIALLDRAVGVHRGGVEAAVLAVLEVGAGAVVAGLPGQGVVGLGRRIGFGHRASPLACPTKRSTPSAVP